MYVNIRSVKQKLDQKKKKKEKEWMSKGRTGSWTCVVSVEDRF